MKTAAFRIAAAALLLWAPSAVLADSVTHAGPADIERSAGELAPYLQCVPYARQVSGVSIYGDAHSWWDRAEGKYPRGNRPRRGAVMAFRPHRNMQLGHVATVSQVIDNRTVLLRHANWSPINGRRGQIEKDVQAVDVSPDNDWSLVRVWYDPIQTLGKTAWPIHGFIYAEQLPATDTSGELERKRSRTRSRELAKKFDQTFDKFTVEQGTSKAYNANIRRAAKPLRVNRDPIRSAVSLYD